MTNSANSVLRNLVGMMAAVIIGGTFIVAAAGPAVAKAATSELAATNSVNSTAISNIVRSA